MDIAGGDAPANSATQSLSKLVCSTQSLSKRIFSLRQESGTHHTASLGSLGRECAWWLNVVSCSCGAVERLLRRLLDKPAAAAVSSPPASFNYGSTKIEGSSAGGGNLPNTPSAELPCPSAGDLLTGLLLRAGNPRRSRTFRNFGDNGRGYR